MSVVTIRNSTKTRRFFHVIKENVGFEFLKVNKIVAPSRLYINIFLEVHIYSLQPFTIKFFFTAAITSYNL